MNNPVYQNILAGATTVVYTKSLIGCCDWAVARGWIPNADLSRKIIHVGAGSWCLFWPFFNVNHWTWTLNVTVPAIYSVQLFVKGLVIQDPNDADVKTMSRTGQPIELCEGPFLFTCVMMYCGLCQFKTEAGVYIMAALGYGDGIAPLFGKRWPLWRFPTFGKGQYKSLGGSLAMFASTLLGIFVLRAGIGAPEQLDAVKVTGVALVATVAEAISGKWDNPVVALATLWFCKQMS